MWQRFTQRARSAVFYAQEEAGRLGVNKVAPEHLLMGLVRDTDNVGCRLLERMGVSPDKVRTEVENEAQRGDGHSGKDMMLTPGAKRVIDFAYDEARQLNNNYIGTEHLLLALIRVDSFKPGQILARLGVGLERTRREVNTLHGEPTEEKARVVVQDDGSMAEVRARAEESVGLYVIMEQLKTLAGGQMRIEEKLDHLLDKQARRPKAGKDDGGEGT